MEISEIIAHIDAEIARLKAARTILAGVTGAERLAAVADEVAPVSSKPAKRKMSAAGKAKIAKAQKARWAKVRKAAKKAVQA
jgi:hypothetical protein